MKKTLIVLSGVYLILVGALAIAVFLIGAFSLPKEPNTQMTQLESVKPIFDVVFAALLLWPIITGLGIILKKNWARFSIFLLSVLAIIISLFSFLVLLVGPFPQDAKVSYQVIKLVFLGLNLIFFVAIPIFFIILFNSKSVKELFVSKEEGKTKTNRPFGITLIAILSFLGGLSCAIFVFKTFIDKMPLFGDIMLSGKALKVYFLIWALINIYIGIGLFKLRKAAWLTAIFSNIFHILLGMANILTISELTLSKINSSLGMNNFNISLIDYKIFTSVGLLLPIIIAIYLISKKDFFTRTNVNGQFRQEGMMLDEKMPSEPKGITIFGILLIFGTLVQVVGGTAGLDVYKDLGQPLPDKVR